MNRGYNTVVFDIETKLVNREQVPILAGVLTETTFQLISTKHCVFDLVEEFLWEQFPKVDCYAHNFANFDSYFIMPALQKKNAKILKIFTRNSNVIFLKCQIRDTVITFRDSFLYTNLSLKEIYKTFKWRKSLVLFLRRRRLHLYLMFDLVGLMYFLEYIQNWSTTVYGVNIIQCISVAHFSYKNYRANFMHKVVYFLARSLRYVLQPHYTGAKIQIGQNIGENLYFYDVNSMYPYFMLNPLPNQYRGSAKKCNLNTFFGFICVTLVKKPKNEFFCNFKHAIVFSEEIKLLIKLGHKFIFHYFLKFVPAKLFTKYVNHFYFFRLWLKPSKIFKYYSKICMNSLYGKFASKVSRYNALQLSMAISSYARAEMSLYKLKYFIYTDTDSIIYTEKLSDKFLGRDIGLMKLVSRIDFGYFLPNYYTYTRGRYRVMKAKVMIKRVLPTLKDLVFTFKLLYFKRRKYSIYLQETIFKYNYPTKNVKQFPAKKPIAGLDWLGKLY